jgi:hypothetical protein
MRATTIPPMLLVLLAMVPLGARQTAGSLLGTIGDTTGKGLPGARVLLTAEDGRVRAATTSPLGRYRIDALPSGKYRIEARMSGFETKASAITVVAGQIDDWSGALLLAGPILGGASIERRVMQETGWEAVDCGRHGAPAVAPHLERSLACALESAKLRRPFSIIVQFTAHGTRAGHGLLAGPDGVIHRFEYERGGLEFHLQPCRFPRVTLGEKPSGFGFTCRPTADSQSSAFALIAHCPSLIARSPQS